MEAEKGNVASWWKSLVVAVGFLQRESWHLALEARIGAHHISPVFLPPAPQPTHRCQLALSVQVGAGLLYATYWEEIPQRFWQAKGTLLPCLHRHLPQQRALQRASALCLVVGLVSKHSCEIAELRSAVYRQFSPRLQERKDVALGQGRAWALCR